MRIFFEFLPIIIFFVVYQFAGIYVATAIAMVAAVLQIAWVWFKLRRLETMHVVSLVLIVVLGGATLLMRNPIFIEWKPTLLNWAFALAFWLSGLIGKRKFLLERLMGEHLTLPRAIWQRLNRLWIAFFIIVGIINLIVAYNFSTTVWVYFKLFGMMGLMLLFVIGQGIYLAKYIKEEKC